MPNIDFFHSMNTPKGYTPGANTLGYYPLNGNANDYSGNGLNGTATGITYVGSSPQSASSNGHYDNRIQIGDSGWRYNSNVTLSTIVKINGSHTNTDHPMAVMLYDATNYVMLGIGFNQTNTLVQFNRLRESITWQETNYTYSPGTSVEHNYILTYDGTTVKGYIDGSLVASTAYSGTGSIYAGANTPTGTSMFSRRFDISTSKNNTNLQQREVIIENVVRDSTKIASYATMMGF